MLNNWSYTPCQGCYKQIDLESELYRKVTDARGVIKFWHNSPGTDCWNKQFVETEVIQNA